MVKKHDELGKFQIAPGVLELIIGLAATEVSGVSGLSGSVVASITDWLKKQGPTKGVKIAADGSDLIVDVHVSVDYAKPMHKVAIEAQKKVKQAIESMTDRKVRAVNIYVDGLTFPIEK